MEVTPTEIRPDIQANDRPEKTSGESSDSPPSRRWVLRGKLDSSAVNSLNEIPFNEPGWPAGIPNALALVLKSRGITTSEQVQKWFRPSLKDLRDPLVLKDMDLAIARLVQARLNQESIVLYADYDLDGTSGLALAVQAFAELGFERVRGYQPQRLTEGYGLHNEAIERLKNETDCTLLISIDLGITAMEEVETARALGIDVIITDHHLPKIDLNGTVILPQALAVVNPNRGDCPSNLGHLCGTGVIFYVVLGLRRALLEEGIIATAFDPKVLLDCFAVGTITDLVPLLHENRILVKHGLLKLAETMRPGLQELLKALELWGRPLTAQDVAIRFAPKLNALSRMGSGIQPIDLYIEKSVDTARELVSQVLSNNQDRQASQKFADDEAERLLKDRTLKGAIVIASEKFHRGVVGLVATRFSQRYGLPTFVGAIEGEAGSIVGSARVPNGTVTSLLDAMEAATDCLDQFGGHSVAAGFEAKRSKFEEFRVTIEKWYLKKELLDGSEGSPKEPLLEYDAPCRFAELNSSFMNWHEQMGPFGAQAPIPFFRFDDCLVAQVRTLKGGHLRLKLAQAGADSLQAIWFSPPKGAEPLLGSRVSVIAEVQWNHYNGSKTIQLMIQDVRSA